MFEHHLLSIKAKSGGTISFKVASQLASEMTQGLLGPVFANVDAYTMGEDYQDLRVASEYAYNLIRHYDNIDPIAVHMIVENYPSHGFVIDVYEAQELLGETVELATSEMINLQGMLGELTTSPQTDNVQVCRIRDILDAQEKGFENAPESETPAAGGDQAESRDARGDGSDRASDTTTGSQDAGDGFDTPDAGPNGANSF